jgi:hypothetical protein
MPITFRPRGPLRRTECERPAPAHPRASAPLGRAPGATLARMGDALYDRIGGSYARMRRADPRLEAAIHAALGDARSVANVGAGAGS